MQAGSRAETRKASSSAASAASALAGSTLSGDSNSEHSSAPPRASRARWSRSHSVIRVDPLVVSDRNDRAFEPIAALAHVRDHLNAYRIPCSALAATTGSRVRNEEPGGAPKS